MTPKHTDTKKKLPHGWRWVKLEDVCEERTGVRDPKASPDAKFQYVDIASVDNSLKRITQAQSILGKDAPSRARQVIHDKDVLVATTRPNLNAVAMVHEQLDGQICSTGFCVLRATELLHPDFLFAYVRHHYFVDALTELVKGALYPAVNDCQVLRQTIPLPPLTEQKRIASILKEQMASTDKARAAAEARLEAVKALPVSFLGETISDTVLASWKKQPIHAVTKTCSGATPSRDRKDYYQGSIPWVKTGELKDNVIFDSEEHVSEKALKETSISLLPSGTLLVAMYGQGQTRGRTALLAIPCTTNQACFAVYPNPEVFNSMFLQFWFMRNYQRLRMETEGRGGNQPNLNGDYLKKQLIPLPPLSEQQMIATRLTAQLASAEKARASAEAELQAINALPAALLRKAFNGEV